MSKITKAKPTVFVSHSTSQLPSTDRCVKIKNSLYSSLDNCGWNVFIDSHGIAPGDNWRTEIIYNLAQAQAGIILFNDRAATLSDWVTAEALILCFRKSIDPNFQVIPVLFDGKNPKDTCFKKYKPFKLNEIQAFPDDISLTPEEIADRIVRNLDIEKAGPPQMNRWVSRMFEILGGIGVDALRPVADDFHLIIEQSLLSISDQHCRDQLCRAVVELMHYKRPMENLETFRELLGKLRNRENANQFQQKLAAKWVENEAMEILLCASRKPEKKGLLTLNTRSHEVIEQYLERARIELSDPKRSVWIFSVSGGAGTEDAVILHKIEQTIREYIGTKSYLGKNYEELPLPKAVKKILNKPGDVAICALPPEFAKKQVLKKLRKDYPRIVFLVQVGYLSKNLTQFKTIGGRPLTPHLSIDKHNELVQLKTRLNSAIDNVFGKGNYEIKC
jgi:hypothetical protein